MQHANRETLHHQFARAQILAPSPAAGCALPLSSSVGRQNLVIEHFGSTGVSSRQGVASGGQPLKRSSRHVCSRNKQNTEIDVGSRDAMIRLRILRQGANSEAHHWPVA